MLMPKREIEPTAAAKSATAPTPAPNAAGPSGEAVAHARRVVFIESPVHLLHEQIASRLEAGDAVEDTRWPGIARVGIIVGGSVALWAVMIGAVSALTA